MTGTHGGDRLADGALVSHRAASSAGALGANPRDPEERLATQALLCTDLSVAPERIIAWFVRRWQMETTLEEMRRHLGVETQRQWSPSAIARTTPVLLGLFSLATLLAHPHLIEQSGPIRQAA